MNVLTIGSAMHDIFIEYDYSGTVYVYANDRRQTFVMFEEGRKIEIDSLQHHVGGGALNSATSFARLGNQVRSFFKTGTDTERDFICKRLQEEGVEIVGTAESSEVPTGNSFVLPCESGDRTILVYRGANLTLTAKELPRDALATSDLVHITPLSGNTACLLPSIAKMAREHGKIVSTNPGASQLTKQVDTLKRALPHISILILNCCEAQLLMDALIGTTDTRQATRVKQAENEAPLLLQETLTPRETHFTLRQFFQAVLAYGLQYAAVTNGKEGVYATDGSDIYFCPSAEAEVVSTLGAGDAFGSTFSSYLANGEPIDRAIQAGVVNAASVLQHLDAQTGLLKRDELDKRIEEIAPNVRSFLL